MYVYNIINSYNRFHCFLRSLLSNPAHFFYAFPHLKYPAITKKNSNWEFGSGASLSINQIQSTYPSLKLTIHVVFHVGVSCSGRARNIPWKRRGGLIPYGPN